MRIYKLTDRVKIKIKDVVITVSPLSFSQKSEIQSYMAKFDGGKDADSLMQGSMLSVKYAIKDISGITDSEGNPYKLSFKDGVLTDECVEELLNSEISTELVASSVSLLNGVPKSIINAITGKPLEGVEVINPLDQKPKVEDK